ncbi:MAG: DEAD/DEAH box helicase family protein [Methanobrevibacter sp.]|jgi:type I restriction enzyme R subunit|nr:DEAD/DEAH box helicase family protein [Candidatus Methanovirga australis]
MESLNNNFYITEDKTRKKHIDPLLKKLGWKNKYIKEEINPIKSDFKNKDYVTYNGKIEKGIDLFIDYLLLDNNGTPLAIIEAKKYSKNPAIGRNQAITYAKEIEKKIGEANFKIPIFLTNGYKWIFIDEYGNERRISGPFSQRDLERRRSLYRSRKNPATMKINSNIVDRPSSIQIVRKLSEHFAECHRKALVEMATGTGKTRVAMAIIDILNRADLVRNVLFIADRITLVTQAKNAFKNFLNEPVADLRDDFDVNSRLYVSTVQTLMGKENNRLFDKFSPGFFDLIVFDEAHRSYYDKNNLIFRYFDAIKIGLTATPRIRESNSTVDLFGESTAEYSYDQALSDGILAPYKGIPIYLKVLNEGIKPSDLDKYNRDNLRRQGKDPNEFEVTGSQFDKVFLNKETNEIILKEFMDKCCISDDNKPAKTIFFLSSKRHANKLKEIWNKLFPNLNEQAQVIVSDMPHSNQAIERFKKQTNPRIVFSVSMLDTGVDIPEICNLVIIKPIFSHIQFWQILGRGTRNLDSCKHTEWLPNRKKNDFLILDFVIGGHSNIEFHNLKRGGEGKIQLSTITKTFNNRVSLLERDLNQKQKDMINNKILEDIDKLDEDLFTVKEKIPTIKKLKRVNDLKGYTDELIEEISPLTINIESDNANISSFILKSEKLFQLVLDIDRDKIQKAKKEITYMIRNVLDKNNLDEIIKNKSNLIKVLQLKFWDDLTFDDVEFLVREIAPSMKYFTPTPKEIVYTNVNDYIINTKEIIKSIPEDEDLKLLLRTNEIAKKLKEGKCISSNELLQLEKELSALKPEITINNIQKETDFLQFLREIIGITREKDPKQLIEERFSKYIIENHDYNEKQLNFLNTLKKVLAKRKSIDIKDIFEDPFDESNVSQFNHDELRDIIDKCNDIKMC